MIKSPIEMIEIVAPGLDHLLDKVVFVGGAVTSLYCDDPAAERIRPTIDVDIIIEIYSNKEYNELEEQLRKIGFAHDIRPEAPICRKIYNGITVDIMPTDASILGFTNRWYSKGIKRPDKIVLPSGIEISILSLSYFIASKIEAFLHRGNNDYIFSNDMEDIITVLDGRLKLSDLDASDHTVKNYLKQQFKKMLNDIRFIESIQGNIGYSSTNAPRAIRLIDFLKNFSGY